MAQRGADILDVGMVSAVGLSAVLTAAAVRAGTCRFRDSPVLDRDFEPIVMGLVPSAELPALAPALGSAGEPVSRRERMLRLAGRALRESLKNETRIKSTPVLLAAPDAHPGYPFPLDPSFLEQLAVQADLPFDLARSRLFPHGRAAGFLALREALDRLQSGAAERIVVGGVDSHLDGMLLAALEHEGRILGGGRDGFIPGEGAGFLLLGRPRSARKSSPEPLARLDEAAHALEPGHRYSSEVYLGAGLDAAFGRLFAALPAMAPVQTVYAGLNGESFNGKEWGVACIRHREHLAEDFAIEHPVDCFGDPGAALGAMVVGLAAIGIHRGYRRAPCLLWCSSDLAERGAALVSEA